MAQLQAAKEGVVGLADEVAQLASVTEDVVDDVRTQAIPQSWFRHILESIAREIPDKITRLNLGPRCFCTQSIACGVAGECGG